LENLDTDLRPPREAILATKAAAEDDGANSYLPFLGQHGLRRAVVEHVARLSGRAYQAERECLITAGGLNGCLVTLTALLDPGDEVIVTDPTYVGMLNRVRLAGGVPRQVPFEWDGREWRLDLEALRSAVGPRTRLLFLMSPSMPSGAVLDRLEWEAVADICRASGTLLLYNAAMERILYDGREYIHPASLPDMRDRTITVGSVSKECRMIGWRVGWVVGPEDLLRDVGLVSISDVVVPVGIAQEAARAALTAGPEDLARAVAAWEARRDAMVRELADLPIRRPGGGWSLLLDAGALGFSGPEASRLLLERGRVAATAMVNWGRRHGEQYVRFVFSNEPVERLEGLRERVRISLGV
ncbi:MAG: pyridoxal phosphate-dependent aminotransferase, partial [Thermodesulfobacteriota bacterium]